MNTRALVIFLGINVVLTGAIGYKYFSNDNQNKATPPVIQQQAISFQSNKEKGIDSTNELSKNPTLPTAQTSNSTLSPISVAMQELKNQAVPTTPIIPTGNIVNNLSTSTAKTESANNGSMVQHIMNLQQGKSSNVLPLVNDSNDSKISSESAQNASKVCTILGPLDLKDKATMDLILSKDVNAGKNKVDISQKPIFEIYWNLGRDRDEAEVLFQKQKQSGTMQEDKFVLVQDEGKDWIVTIAEINSSIEYARDIANKLATTGEKYNAGGKWNYRTKPNGYFYKFDDFSQIEAKTKNSLNVMLNVNKAPC